MTYQRNETPEPLASDFAADDAVIAMAEECGFEWTQIGWDKKPMRFMCYPHQIIALAKRLRATPAPGAPEQEAAEKMAKLLEEARSDGCESIREWIDSLKQSVGTYRLERNSARDAYRRHRDESEARGKLINIVLGMVGAPPGANVVMAVAAALPPSAAGEKTS